MSTENRPRAIEEATVLELASDVRFRVIDRQAVVVVQEQNNALVLNEMSTEILQLLDGRTSVGSLIEELLERYEVEPDDLRRDVMGHLRELIEAGVIQDHAAA